MPDKRKHKNAFALSIVLWIVAALLIGISFVASSASKSIKITQQLDDKAQAKLEVESFFEILKFYVLTADYDSISLKNDKIDYLIHNQIVLDGRKYHIKNITFSLQDTSSLINVFYPDAKMIAKLATNQKQREEYLTIRDSIYDWVDKDNIVHLNGAENAYYTLEKGYSYFPRNSTALQSIWELKLIRGVNRLSSQKYKYLSQYLYFSGRRIQLNLALADNEILIKALNLDRLDFMLLKRLKNKDDKSFLKYISKNENYNFQKMGFSLSFEMKIFIEADVNQAKSRLEALVDFNPDINGRITIKKINIY